MPTPKNITYHQQSRVLQVEFTAGEQYSLSAEFLRVNSPSAEVQGHGPDQAVLQSGKQDVAIESIEPVGNYAILLRFSDDHDTGIFAWDVLRELGENHDALWENYLTRLEQAGKTRQGKS